MCFGLRCSEQDKSVDDNDTCSLFELSSRHLVNQLKQQLVERDALILELEKQLEESYELKLYSRRKLEQENKMMRECLEIIKEDKYEATPWLTVETGSAKRAKECLAKLTKDGK
jgi:hypothetical protein